MRRLSAVVAPLAACLLLAGCTTHRADLAVDGPAQVVHGLDVGALTTSTRVLLLREAGRRYRLSTEAIVPLVSTAAILFKRTHATAMFALTEQLGSALLDARVTRGGVTGYFGASSGVKPSPQVTAASGLAFADAFDATGDRRFSAAAVDAAKAVSTPALGWVHTSWGDGVSTNRRAAGPDIATSATAALLLVRAAKLGAPALAAKGKAALHTIYTTQAAVGHWWMSPGGRDAMTNVQWATTLYGLQAEGSYESLGITGGGIPALAAAVFGPHVKNPKTGLLGDPLGVALTVSVLAIYGERSLADAVIPRIVATQRPDAAIGLAPPSDDLSQSYFGLAFARDLIGPARNA